MRDGKIDHEYCPSANQNVGITVFAHPAATAANCSGTVPRQQHHENSHVRRTATRIHHEQLREWKLFNLLCKSGPAPLGCGRLKEQEKLCAPRSPWKTPLRFSTSRRGLERVPLGRDLGTAGSPLSSVPSGWIVLRLSDRWLLTLTPIMHVHHSIRMLPLRDSQTSSALSG